MEKPETRWIISSHDWVKWTYCTCIVDRPKQYASSASSGKGSDGKPSIKRTQSKKRDLSQAMGQRVQRDTDDFHVNAMNSYEQ